VTAAVALAVVGTTGGGIAGALTVRADQRRAALAQAKARAAGAAATAIRNAAIARTAYAAGVDRVAAQVVTALQPVEDVLRGLDQYVPAAFPGSRDVLAHAGVAGTLRATASQVAALSAPADLRSQSVVVREAIDALRDHFTDLATAVAKVRGKALFDTLTGDLLDELRAAEYTWRAAVVTLHQHAGGTPPATPSAFGALSDAPPLPATRAAWIGAADAACGSAVVQLNPIARVKDRSGFVRWARRAAAANLAMDAAIRALPLPPDDTATLQATVLAHLGSNDAWARAIKKAADDLSRHVAASTVVAELNQADTMLVLLRPLSRGLTRYGATYCGEFTDPGIPSASAPSSSAAPGSAGRT
jgi:hypothetical protein